MAGAVSHHPDARLCPAVCHRRGDPNRCVKALPGPAEGIVPRYRFGTAAPRALSEGVGPHSAEVLGDGDDGVDRDVPIQLFGHTRVARDSTDPSNRQS